MTLAQCSKILERASQLPQGEILAVQHDFKRLFLVITCEILGLNCLGKMHYLEAQSMYGASKRTAMRVSNFGYIGPSLSVKNHPFT